MYNGLTNAFRSTVCCPDCSPACAINRRNQGINCHPQIMVQTLLAMTKKHRRIEEVRSGDGWLLLETEISFSNGDKTWLSKTSARAADSIDALGMEIMLHAKRGVRPAMRLNPQGDETAI